MSSVNAATAENALVAFVACLFLLLLIAWAVSWAGRI